MPLTNWIRRSSLKNKILIFAALLLFLAISAVGIYAYFLAAHQVVEKVNETQLGLVRQVSNNLDYILDDVDNVTNFIVFDPNLQKELKEVTVDSNILSYSDLCDYLDRILASKNYISMISLYGYNGLAYSTVSGFTSNSVVPFAEFKRNPLYQKALNLDGGIGIEYFRNNPVVVIDNRQRRILIYRIIKDIDKYYNLGVLLIWIDEEKIRNMYRANVPAEGSIFIVDQSGTIISSSDPSKIETHVLGQTYYKLLKGQTGSATLKINNRQMLFTFSTSQETGWKVITLTPAAVLTERINWLAFIIVSLGIGCYMLLFYLSTFITRIITNPIQQLLNSIKKVQKGDFSQQVYFSNEDEIGELGQGYNAMIAHIKDLIDRVYKLQIQEREAELNALQAQINPHFLYNTLDTIFWKAEKNQAPEISEMVYALSRIFRLSLNRGNELATVAQEKELIEYYLVLQQIRFQDKLTYQMDFDEQLFDLKMPKLVLQPFVENAIIHGIEGLETHGRIEITGRLEDECMVFTIVDNGIGMTDDKIQQIITRSAPDRADPNTVNTVSGGYAIRNVLERLELYYESNYRLVFDSIPGSGTTVNIMIPKHCQWEKHHG